jgi:hypothetical protein
MIHPLHFLLPSCIGLLIACVSSITAQQQDLNKDFLDAVEKRDVPLWTTR